MTHSNHPLTTQLGSVKFVTVCFPFFLLFLFFASVHAQEYSWGAGPMSGGVAAYISPSDVPLQPAACRIQYRFYADDVDMSVNNLDVFNYAAILGDQGRDPPFPLTVNKVSQTSVIDGSPRPYVALDFDISFPDTNSQAVAQQLGEVRVYLKFQEIPNEFRYTFTSHTRTGEASPWKDYPVVYYPSGWAPTFGPRRWLTQIDTPDRKTDSSITLTFTVYMSDLLDVTTYFTIPYNTTEWSSTSELTLVGDPMTLFRTYGSNPSITTSNVCQDTFDSSVKMHCLHFIPDPNMVYNRPYDITSQKISFTLTLSVSTPIDTFPLLYIRQKPLNLPVGASKPKTPPVATVVDQIIKYKSTAYTSTNTAFYLSQLPVSKPLNAVGFTNTFYLKVLFPLQNLPVGVSVVPVPKHEKYLDFISASCTAWTDQANSQTQITSLFISQPATNPPLMWHNGVDQTGATFNAIVASCLFHISPVVALREDAATTTIIDRIHIASSESEDLGKGFTIQSNEYNQNLGSGLSLSTQLITMPTISAPSSTTLTYKSITQVLTYNSYGALPNGHALWIVLSAPLQSMHGFSLSSQLVGTVAVTKDHATHVRELTPTLSCSSFPISDPKMKYVKIPSLTSQQALYRCHFPNIDAESGTDGGNSVQAIGDYAIQFTFTKTTSDIQLVSDDRIAKQIVNVYLTVPPISQTAYANLVEPAPDLIYMWNDLVKVVTFDVGVSTNIQPHYAEVVISSKKSGKAYTLPTMPLSDVTASSPVLGSPTDLSASIDIRLLSSFWSQPAYLDQTVMVNLYRTDEPTVSLFSKTLPTSTLLVASLSTLNPSPLSTDLDFPSTSLFFQISIPGTDFPTIRTQSFSLATKPACFETCGVNGVCNEVTQVCDCAKGYSGKTCLKSYCDDCTANIESCSAADSKCSCKTGFFGDFCDQSTCVQQGRTRCNNRGYFKESPLDGRCLVDQCTCEGYFSGNRCALCSLICVNGGIPRASCAACGCPQGFSGLTCACRSMTATLSLPELSHPILSAINALNDPTAISPDLQNSYNVLLMNVRDTLANIMEFPSTGIQVTTIVQHDQPASITISITFTFGCDGDTNTNITLDTKWNNLIDRLRTSADLLGFDLLFSDGSTTSERTIDNSLTPVPATDIDKYVPPTDDSNDNASFSVSPLAISILAVVVVILHFY